MNNDRRKQIRQIAASLLDLREQIEQLQEQEQDAFDNLPESLQQGERGQVMEAALEQLSQAGDALDEAGQALEEAAA